MQALLTDLYQLTMAQGYWRGGLADAQACFYVHFRENPFKGGYAIACGLAQLAEQLEGFRFSSDDCAYLATLKAAEGVPLFSPGFIDSLAGLALTVDVDAVREGTAVFPYEPVVRVMGPILQCQLVETALINIVNYQTLIATKAARICEVAHGPVAEFGLRRAQGPAGGLFASRAAIVGGCASTSNVEAGRMFGVPVSGTHAHSWVMAHDDELAAFRAFVDTFPHTSVLLVDTYDTLKGVRNAITVAKEMEQRGQRLAGIRIDSGDLAWLSVQARGLLDDEGLGYVRIVASNDLDEHTIQSLYEQGARIDSWGVGTRLVTAWDHPALTGVYKLCAIRKVPEGRWEPQLKVSEMRSKSTLPGLLAARRYLDAGGTFVGDMVYDEQMPPADDLIIDPVDELRRKDLAGCESMGLLEPLVRNGRTVAEPASALEAQKVTRESLGRLHPTNKRLLNPHSYPVGLERALLAQRDRLLKDSLMLPGNGSQGA
ncbi:MAG: nicotinate phosphoribosyltransferase [Coriobacteriales bacterium]|jgi:nicotinate phosphoribosyltransferase|nr:nicotinate phosphoribosyltransferase [Coriobacteriales bacterium]